MVRRQCQDPVGQLHCFRGIRLAELPFRASQQRLYGVLGMTHGLLDVGQSHLHAQIVRLGVEQLAKQCRCRLGPACLEVRLRKLKVDGARFAQNTLLDVKLG
jgi:hypothetical protein